ncbi:MAG: hypothetical protein ACLPGW_04545, partial [Roseiarcus sp.]
QITHHENIACVIVAPRQSSLRRDRQNGQPDCRCFPIQIVALHSRSAPPSKHWRNLQSASLIALRTSRAGDPGVELAAGRLVVWHAQTEKGFRGLSKIAGDLDEPNLSVVYDPN